MQKGWWGLTPNIRPYPPVIKHGLLEKHPFSSTNFHFWWSFSGHAWGHKSGYNLSRCIPLTSPLSRHFCWSNHWQTTMFVDEIQFIFAKRHLNSTPFHRSSKLSEGCFPSPLKSAPLRGAVLGVCGAFNDDANGKKERNQSKTWI